VLREEHPLAFPNLDHPLSFHVLLAKLLILVEVRKGFKGFNDEQKHIVDRLLIFIHALRAHVSSESRQGALGNNQSEKELHIRSRPMQLAVGTILQSSGDWIL
jgi:hypothetical protein